MRPRIHIIAPASPCTGFMETMGWRSPDELLTVIQAACGLSFDVTAQGNLLIAAEDELRGGRTDDAARAQDIEAALADDGVCAVVALRGGAWMTRILPHVDFSVLDRRTLPVAVWGFSELTTLVNIVGAHRHGRGVYDMGPAFLSYGLRRYAKQNARTALMSGENAEAWAARMLRPKFVEFFESVRARLTGSPGPIEIDAKLVRGGAEDIPKEAVFVGGNLTVLSTLIGSRYDACIAPAGRWLLLEDFNDKPERLDRFLSHLTLSGYFERCAGVLLGDFHQQERDLLQAVVATLEFHLPTGRAVPVLATSVVGHVLPMMPLPLHTPASLTPTGHGGYRIAFPPDALTLCPRS